MKLRISKSRRRTRRNTKKRTQRRRIRGGTTQLEVFYGTTQVAGQELSKELTQSEPIVKFPSTNINKLYTFVMWDPDVPPQAQPGFAHWIATNLKSSNDIQQNQLLDYKGPSPPSGTHHYFFGLFEQERTISPRQPERTRFSIEQFVAENNLRKIAEIFMKVSAI